MVSVLAPMVKYEAQKGKYNFVLAPLVKYAIHCCSKKSPVLAPFPLSDGHDERKIAMQQLICPLDGLHCEKDCPDRYHDEPEGGCLLTTFLELGGNTLILGKVEKTAPVSPAPRRSKRNKQPGKVIDSTSIMRV